MVAPELCQPIWQGGGIATPGRGVVFQVLKSANIIFCNFYLKFYLFLLFFFIFSFVFPKKLHYQESASNVLNVSGKWTLHRDTQRMAGRIEHFLILVRTVPRGFRTKLRIELRIASESRIELMEVTQMHKKI
jgi:hypothetical protein